MPRKLRKNKQKNLKKRQLQTGLEEVVKRDFEFSFQNIPQHKNTKTVAKRLDNSLLSQDLNLVKKDLIKSMFLALSIFSLEIVIYFAWFKG